MNRMPKFSGDRLRHLRGWKAVWMLAGSVVLPAAASAQAVPPPTTREELDIESRLGQRAPSRSTLDVQGGIERGPCPLADPAFAQTRVTFSKVLFPDLKAVDPAVLDDTWRDFAGTEQPVAVLCEVRDRAATALRAMGYLAAVQIPPQRIEKLGEVSMDVLVAHLAEVQVRGEAGANERAIADHLAKLTSEPYFNTRVAERQLLLLSDIPGYQVRLTLKPVAGSPGDVTGDVVVKRRAFELFAGLQNLGSKAVGREGVFVQAVANGMTGLADQTSVSLFNTLDFSEQTVLQASHSFAAGANGLRFNASLLYGHSEPAGPLKFKSDTLSGELGLTYPLVRRRALSLLAGGGLEIVNQDVDFGAVPLTRDRLRILYGRLSLDTVDSASANGRGGYTGAEPRYHLSAMVEARHGIAGLGASNDCLPITNCTSPNVPISNLLADPSAFVLRAEATAEFRPVPMITIAAAPRAQYSPDTLLSYERFSVGNYTIGRSLDPGTLLGDSGIGTSLELRYGRLSRTMDNGLALQPFAFVDAAWTWTHYGPANDPQDAFTGGGGVRARWGDRIDSAFTLSVPFNNAGFTSTKGDVRFLFTIRARLLPWDPS
ncbi:ShlB/FhaC/HecB family hemolysin secretion/activation protein [Novosphingobium album (ex Hu et al. 2023)]|uniref:ShlB/FhaC/HecB family hemolysin secretion/activation protein n=1 Tax=Novosphingobium album (ex Hu et al. 2023) TaxID=2930093 RepID=A0ABT0AXW9_9SPHN|nr:ShlB/FhaC/HecB family hemolysin secretion/activation protein [Novosphingobium album (ex Hu et al. 2023)]MCJ2177495.1 ShlB/FhaC/HecB family hemolysin secretion/activation protein [Novosphingobium album (ex Hu et al. 2023)]